MAVLMSISRVASVEGNTTDTALVRLFSCVCAHMSNQAGLLSEPSRTEVAGKWSFPCVGALMVHHDSPFLRAVLAKVARKHLLAFPTQVVATMNKRRWWAAFALLALSWLFFSRSVNY